MTGVRPDHNRVLRDAARSALSPLGVTQKGRSRVWLDDRLWHLIVVEFQPGAFDNGSYLNVGVMWHWSVHEWISFDFGGRLGYWVRADIGDWSAKSATLADTAARRIIEVRSDIPDVAAAARVLLASVERPVGQPVFDAAMAAGLAGKPELSRRLFDRLADQDPADVYLSELRSLVTDPARFRARVVTEIQRSRAVHDLRPADDGDIEAAFSGIYPE